MLPAAEELEQQREQLLKSVEQAWGASLEEPVEPIISQIKMESGTAFELLQQMEQALGKKESSPIVVAVPAQILSRRQIESLELKNIHLGAAMEILSKITGFQTTKRGGNWWVEQREVGVDEFAMRTYLFSPEDMKAIGLEHDGKTKSANVSRGGKKWPIGEGAMATYVPSSGMLVVRAPEEEIAKLDAIALLRKTEYEVTLRK